MDQTIINWAFAALGGAISWILKMVWDAVRDLRDSLQKVQQDLPETYVRRDDFKDAVRDMRDDMREGFKHVDARLDVLFERLDSKEDRNK